MNTQSLNRRPITRITTLVLSVMLAACSGDETSPSLPASSSTVTLSSSSNLAVSSSESSITASSSEDSVASSSAPVPSDCSLAEVQQVFTDNSCMFCHNAQIFGANGGGLNLESPNLGREISA